MRRGPGHAGLGLGRCPSPSSRPEGRGTHGTSPLLEAEISSSLYSGVESSLGDRVLGEVRKGLGFPGGSVIKNPPAKPETQVQFLGQEAPLEKEMATYSSIFAWEIPWTEEPSGLQFMGCQRVGDNLATKQQEQEEMDSFVALPAKRYTAGPCLLNHLGK